MTIIVPAIFFAIGLGLIVWGIQSHRLGKRVHSWPTTTGVITSAGVSERPRMVGKDAMSEPSFAHHVHYTYTVNGHSFRGDRIAIGLHRLSRTGDSAMAQIARYTKGGKVIVYYDPGNPRFSVLQAGARGVSTLIQWGVGIIVFFSLLLVIILR